LTSIHNRVVRWLDIRFPEFTIVFKDWRRNAALITLRSFPTPEKVMEMDLIALQSILSMALLHFFLR